MICPQCSLYIDDPGATTCTRCGQSLSSRPARVPTSEQFYQPSPFTPTQPAQPDAPTPTPSQWMKPSIAPAYSKPVRKRMSRRKRNLISLAIIIIVFLACGVGIYSALIAPSQPASSVIPPGPNVLFSDPLSNPSNGWVTDSGHCFFQDNAYHIKNDFYCLAPVGNIADADITVHAEQVAGTPLYPYGIVFREAGEGDWYQFAIDSNSKWIFLKSVNNTVTTLVDYTPNSAINGGLNTLNTLRVVAKGTHFTFYINGTQVGTADDTTYTSGGIGLSAGGVTTEVAYTNIEIDKVS